MKKHIYISLFVFFLAPGLSLALNLDSLLAAFKDGNQPDTTKAILLIKIGKEYKKENSELAISKFEQALSYARKAGSEKWEHNSLKELASVLTLIASDYLNHGNSEKALEYYNRSLNNKNEVGDTIGVVNNYHNIGWVYELTGQYDMAMHIYTKGLNILNASEFKEETIELLSAIGNIYRKQGDYKEALQYYQKALVISEGTGDKHKIANSLNNIGTIYHGQGDYTKAMGYYLNTFKMYKEIGHESNVSISLNNIGVIYLEQGDNAKSLDYFLRSLAISKKSGEKYNMSNSLVNIGWSYYWEGDYGKALEFCTKSLKLKKELGDKRGVCLALYYVGNIYINQGDYGQALTVGKKALILAQETGNKLRIKEVSELLSGIYEKTSHPAKSLEMYELHIQMRDSLNSGEVRKTLDQFEQKMEHDKEMLVLEQEQERKAALAVEEKKTRVQRTNTIAGVGILALLLSVLIFKRYQYTQRQKKVIGAQKKVVEEHTKELTDSIRYARNIQKAVVPTSDDLSVLPEHFVLFQPKDIVSGDFYWMAEKEGRVYFAACDCTGHGVPGAFMSMLIKALLDEAVNQKGLTKPNEIFYEVRKDVIEALKQSAEVGTQKDGMDAVLCAWDGNGTLEYACAYNPLVLLRDGELQQTKADKQPVGILTGAQKPFTHHELQLQKGDTIYLFSDGYPDQFGGPKDKKFKLKNMKDLLLHNQHKPLAAQKDILQKAMDKWMGDTEQIDDILVMGVRF